MLRHKMALWFAFIILLFVLWFAGWYAFAGFANDKVTALIGSLKAKNIEIECDGQDIVGFPFRVGLFCKNTSVDDRVHGYQFSTNEIRSAAQFYAPRENIIEVKSPFLFDSGNLSLDAEWSLMRLFVHVKEPGFDLLSTNFRTVAGTVNGNAFQIESGNVHLRPSPSAPGDLDIAGTNKSLSIVIDGQRANLNTSFDVTAGGGYQHFIEDRETLDSYLKPGVTLALRELILDIENENTSLSLDGTLLIEADRSLTGKVNIGLENDEGLARFVSSFNPELGPSVNVLSQGVKLLGQPQQKNGHNYQVVTLDINRGRARLGLFEIGKLPKVPDLR